MNTSSLESRLREKISTENPRPGFETRIQAMAREPHSPRPPVKKSRLRRVALPAFTLIALGIMITPKDKPAQKTTASQVDPVIPPNEKSAMTKIEEPVQREIQGLKNDAKWTMGLFQKALPSLPAKKEDQTPPPKNKPVTPK